MFLAHGIDVSIGDEASVQIAADKMTTYEWLAASGFPTVRTASPQTVLSDSYEWEFPLIVKPRVGSASAGVSLVSNAADLERAMRLRDDLIVQELASGSEYTVNLYVDRPGRCLAAVPHRRIQTRGGEVSKGLTVKDSRIIALGRRVAEALPGMRGAMNMQCFVSDKGDIRIIELNARFGGGYPLAHNAGAQFTTWLLQEVQGQHPSPPMDDWTDGLLMLRYDQEVFVPTKDLAYA
jgi:carbamoyl-phosphate synthase large subunit